MTKIRKQVYDLTLQDFEQYPIWEFALDEEGEEGQDEATVGPFETQSQNDFPAGIFVTKATFTLSDGTEARGFIYPPFGKDEGNDLGIIQPNIITDKGQVPFWHGIREPNSIEINDYSRMLGKSSSEIFPLKYKSDKKIDLKYIEGMLEGFYFLQQNKSWFSQKSTYKVKFKK